MPEYEHKCNNCNHEWDEEYSIKADPPTLCPSCNTEGFVNRLISGGSGKGIVSLTGKDLINKVKSDAEQYKNEAFKSEKALEDIVGRDKLQANTVAHERAMNEYGRPKIRTKK